MRRVELLLLGFLVVGCADQQLNRRLNDFIGQNIHYAVDILGHPDGRREIMGDTVYTWTTHREVVLFETSSSPVGGTPVYGETSTAGRLISGTTRTSVTASRVDGTATTFDPTAFQCTIQIAADKSGTIKRYKIEGTQDVCQRYASRFH